MGQLIIPNEIKINGPWILDENQLEELDEVIKDIESKINESYEIELEREIDKEFDRLKKWDDKLTKEKAKKEIAKKYPFSNHEKFAILESKDGKRLKDSLLVGLLKDKNINDFIPTELQIELEKGPIRFRLEISSKYNGELQTRISISDDNLANEINYLLNKWIKKNRPNAVIQFWSSTVRYFIIPLFFILLFFSSLLLKSGNDNYKDDLKSKERDLLTNGISDDEIKDAIELILKFESDYLPSDYKSESNFNSKIFKVWGYGSICLLLLAISPKTTIGVGKKKRYAWFYKKWIYVVTVFIPLTIILPIILERIL